MHLPPRQIPPGQGTPLAFLPQVPLLHWSHGSEQLLHMVPDGTQAPLLSQAPPGHWEPGRAITQVPVSMLQLLQGPVQLAGHMGLGRQVPFWQVPPGQLDPLGCGAQLRLLALQA